MGAAAVQAQGARARLLLGLAWALILAAAYLR